MEWTDPRPPMECFSLVIDALLRSIAQRLGFMPQALLMLTVDWVRRRRVRFIALVGRIRAGISPRLRAPRPGRRTVSRPGNGLLPPLPRVFGWICRHVPHWAAGHGAQLACLLTHPEMAALIAADPRVGRLLRPLLLALGVEQLPGVLPLRPAPRPPRAHPIRTHPMRTRTAQAEPAQGGPQPSEPRKSGPWQLGPSQFGPSPSTWPPPPPRENCAATAFARQPPADIRAAAKLAIARSIFGNVG